MKIFTVAIKGSEKPFHYHIKADGFILDISEGSYKFTSKGQAGNAEVVGIVRVSEVIAIIEESVLGSQKGHN